MTKVPGGAPGWRCCCFPARAGGRAGAGDVDPPFAPQSPSAIELSYTLRRWSPWLTLGAALLGLALAVRLFEEIPG